mgnify:FL=1
MKKLTIGRLARWAAYAVAAACCVVGGVSPAYGAGDPIPVPRVTPSQVPSSPLLPGREIAINAKVSQDRDDFSGEETYSTNLTVRFWGTGRGADLTQQDCSDLVATFWSGRSNNYHVKAQYLSNSCIITADYAREARHAFYSLDESGHVQVRAPLVYLNQIASSLDNASVTELEVDFTSIDNARCNAAPSLEHLDDLISSDPNAPSHLSYCQWKTKEGATIPTSDDPLLEGEVEQTLFDYENATVGPFIDLPAPINPFTITPTQADEPASGTSADATSESASSRGLLIGVGAGAALLLLAAAAAITWARRRTS